MINESLCQGFVSLKSKELLTSPSGFPTSPSGFPTLQSLCHIANTLRSLTHEPEFVILLFRNLWWFCSGYSVKFRLLSVPFTVFRVGKVLACPSASVSSRFRTGSSGGFSKGPRLFLFSHLCLFHLLPQEPCFFPSHPPRLPQVGAKSGLSFKAQLGIPLPCEPFWFPRWAHPWYCWFFSQVPYGVHIPTSAAASLGPVFSLT